MNNIETLIAQLCPNGVEFRELGDVVNIFIGSFVKKTEQDDSYVCPVYNGGIQPTGYFNDFNSTKNSVVMSARGANCGFLNYVTVDFWAGNSCYVMKELQENLNSKFLFYVLKENETNIYNLRQTSGIPAINSGPLSKFKIPIPPLPIQQEIVNILDKFTHLEAEMERELEARRKQYEYYREQLFYFEGKEVERKTLGEVTSLITKGTTPKSYKQSGISFIKTEAFDGSLIVKNKLSFIDEITHQTFLKRSILKSNDILFTIAGATIGKCAIVTDDILPANTNQALAIIRLTKYVDKKYIFYILKSNYMRQYINKSVKGSAQPNLNLQQLNEFLFPIPPLAEQERIVAILDKFDKLVNSKSEGLPAEIAARHKQYEYYRGKLLDFKALTN